MLAPAVLALWVMDATATDPGTKIETDCKQADFAPVTPYAGETAGPSAYSALSEEGRDVALRLFLAQTAVAASDEERRHGNDGGNLASNTAGCRAAAPALSAPPCNPGNDCWTLERICVARLAASGWGQVLHDMYKAGVLDMEMMLGIWKSDEQTVEIPATSAGASPAE